MPTSLMGMWSTATLLSVCGASASITRAFSRSSLVIALRFLPICFSAGRSVWRFRYHVMPCNGLTML